MTDLGSAINTQPYLKICTQCGNEKLSTEFGKDKQLKSGLKPYCKICASKMRKRWINKNKHKNKEYYVKYRPKAVERYKDKQHIKQENNKCIKCGRALIGRQLLSKYCHVCKKEVIKEWKRESYKRNIDTVIKYNAEHREDINKKQAIREFNGRENLKDRYITKLLRERAGFTVDQLKENPEIIEIKRLIIKTKRL